MVEFRPLTPADVPAMLPIEQSAHPFPWSERVLLASFGERYANVGCWQAGQLLGYYIAEQLLDESTLHNICVDPRHQGEGIGRLLLAHYLQASDAAGCRCWWLEVRRSNERAQHLYEQAGYQQVGVRKGYYRAEQGQEDALVMRRGASGEGGG
ncbi:MAG: ribosomal protein S18-alanine N-acetyltransferase [Aeromonadaceae bacterium]